MPVNYSNALKDQRMSDVLADIDAQSSPGSLEICDTSYDVLCVIMLAKPSFIEGSQELTMASAPRSGVATASGIAALARIKDGNGTVIINGLTIGLAAADIILNSLSVTSGQTITLASATIQHG